MTWLVDVETLRLESDSRPTAVVLFGIVFVAGALYWMVPNRAKNLIVTGLGVAGLTLLSPASAIALEIIVLVVGVGLADGKGGRALRCVSMLVLGFVLYKVLLRANPFDQTVALIGFVYAVPRAVHVLVDSKYRQLERPSLGLLHSYFWFFPTLIIGPIHRLEAFRRSLRRRRFDVPQIASGLERILIGLLSVKVLADWMVSGRLGRAIEPLAEERPGLGSLLASVEYGLNLYFTFAGWSAVAIGTAAIFGFEVSENFDRPFTKRNLAEFWRSWHMSLTSWTRDFVYQPVAATTRRPALAIVATMFAIALWHEFSPRYLIWALWHAVGLLIHRWFKKRSDRQEFGTFAPTWVHPALRRASATALTVLFVTLGFTITRTDTVSAGLSELSMIFRGSYL